MCLIEYLFFSLRIVKVFKWFFLFLSECHPTVLKYRLWNFKLGDTKLDKFLAKNEQVQRIFYIFWNANFLSQKSILEQKAVQFYYQRIFLVNMMFQISHWWKSLCIKNRSMFCLHSKGQIKSEWIYEIIHIPK